MTRAVLLATVALCFLLGEGWLAILGFAVAGLIRYMRPALMTEPPIGRMGAAP